MKQPKEILSIHDYGDTVCDRYTFVLRKRFYPTNPGFHPHLGTSENGLGISMFGECLRGKHLGKRVTWESLSKELQNHVAERLKP